MKYQNITQITADNLCARCGTCVAACPQRAITLDAHFYPRTNNSCNNCTLCVQCCPGWEVNYPAFTPTPPAEKYLEGNYNDTYLSSSANGQIKNNASGGGIVTGLLDYLCDIGYINGAIVTGGDSNSPWESIPLLATSRKQILNNSQSRYTIVPVNKVLEEIKSKTGNFALVALPCQVQGFCKLAALNPKIADKIKLIIGLYCHLNMELEATTKLIRNNGIKLTDLTRLEYRGGCWPGRIRVTHKDGRITNLHAFDIKDGALNYLKRLYTAPRCLLCVDAAAELADISIADGWIRDKKGGWLLEDQGRWSILLERTPRGREVITMALKDKALMKRTLPAELILSAHSTMIREKKKGAFIRIEKLQKKKLPYPDYHLSPPAISRHDRWRENLYQLTLLPSRFAWTRNILMKLSFSKAGVLFTWLKLSWKKWARKVKI